MSSSGEKKNEADGLNRLMETGRRLFGGARDAKARVGPERRVGKRVPLPIPVRVTVGDGLPHPARVREVNLPGLSLEACEGARVGDRVRVEFDGYPGVSPPFFILGHVARVAGQSQEAVAIKVDRKATAPEALQSYKTLVLHYLHHKPLLEDINKGYFEGRCESCGWVGRVGRRSPRCSQCGSKVVPI